jgi:hypothetical protein
VLSLIINYIPNIGENMKKLLAFAAGTVMSMSAFAAAAPSTLPAGPIYLKFSGQEQIAINGAHTYGNNEINWGVILVSTAERGDVNTPHDAVDPNGDIFYVNGQGGQITGMFYGIQQGTPSATNPFPATGGYLDLYWRDLDTMSKSTVSNTGINPSIRIDESHAAGFTEGQFLARIMFDTGMDTSNATNTIVGDTTPSSNGFTGQADSYGSVVASAGGLWADQLNSDWFNSYLGQRDLRFKNSYNYNPVWSNGSNILGARIDDPGQAFALPEPGALSLMGLAMVGMGAALRRREKKAAK